MVHIEYLLYLYRLIVKMLIDFFIYLSVVLVGHASVHSSSPHFVACLQTLNHPKCYAVISDLTKKCNPQCMIRNFGDACYLSVVGVLSVVMY